MIDSPDDKTPSKDSETPYTEALLELHAIVQDIENDNVDLDLSLIHI